jgi:hypothetical protein
MRMAKSYAWEKEEKHTKPLKTEYHGKSTRQSKTCAFSLCRALVKSPISDESLGYSRLKAILPQSIGVPRDPTCGAKSGDEICPGFSIILKR